MQTVIYFKETGKIHNVVENTIEVGTDYVKGRDSEVRGCDMEQLAFITVPNNTVTIEQIETPFDPQPTYRTEIQQVWNEEAEEWENIEVTIEVPYESIYRDQVDYVLNEETGEYEEVISQVEVLPEPTYREVFVPEEINPEWEDHSSDFLPEPSVVNVLAEEFIEEKIKNMQNQMVINQLGQELVNIKLQLMGGM